MLDLVGAARRFTVEQINHSGDVSTIDDVVVTPAIRASSAWTFWLITELVVEWIVATPAISAGRIDAHLVRLLAEVMGVGRSFAPVVVGLSGIGTVEAITRSVCDTRPRSTADSARTRWGSTRRTTRGCPAAGAPYLLSATTTCLTDDTGPARLES